MNGIDFCSHGIFFRSVNVWPIKFVITVLTLTVTKLSTIVQAHGKDTSPLERRRLEV